MISLQRLKDRLAELESKAQQISDLKAIAASPSWKSLSSTLEASIIARINRLCDKSCDPEETSMLRAEIHALRWFLRVPKINETEVKNLDERLQGLRKQIERITVLGVGAQREQETADAMDAMDTITTQLEGGRQ